MVFISLIREIFLKLGNLSATALLGFALVDYDLTLPIGYMLPSNAQELMFLGNVVMWHGLLWVSLFCWTLWLIFTAYEKFVESRT